LKNVAFINNILMSLIKAACLHLLLWNVFEATINLMLLAIYLKGFLFDDCCVQITNSTLIMIYGYNCLNTTSLYFSSFLLPLQI
jgi:hypothetical protein